MNSEEFRFRERIVVYFPIFFEIVNKERKTANLRI
jgi:hypothetical protein